MRKNLLIITGSPRKGGNSEMLAEAFAKGARSNGHMVNFFNAAQKKSAAVKHAEPVGAKAVPVHLLMALQS